MLHTYRVFEITEFKCQKCQADLNFLQTCSENNLIPKFLYFKPYDPEVRKSELYRSTQKRFLNEAIKTKEKRLNNLEKQKNQLRNQLKASVSYLDFTHMDNLIEKNNYKKITRVKAVHAKKLGNIGYSEIEELAPDKVLFNFSSRSLTTAEKSLLCKGLKFAIPPRKLSIEHHLYTFEKLFESLKKHEVYHNESFTYETFKDKLRHLAKSTFTRYQKHKPKGILSDDEEKAMISLSKDKSIVISRPDKGNGVVLMDKSSYISKVNLILTDATKFEKVEKNKDNP